MQAANRVAFNTFVMYAKVLITVGITLYSTRLILGELGESDFGAFNLVAGIIGMLAFLNASAATAIFRYMSYALGMNDKERFFEVYKIARKLSLLLGIVVVAVIEILGFFFLGKLNIAPERFFAVQTVFHCIAASTFFSIWAMPYESAITANEDIFVISIMYIVEAFFKFGIAVYLIYAPFDKLIVYGILIAAIYIVSNIYKKIYCQKYGKSQVRQKPDKKLFFEIARFSGWTAFEPFSTVFSVQGVAVILNVFGGTVVNAAYGIANQVSGQMNYFSTSLLSAINPQIIKSESGGDRARTVRLSMFACKISFFLLAFFSLPLIVEMSYVLGLWLKNVPEYTVLFCRLILISVLISQLTYGLQGGIQAVGRIRNYQTILGIIKILALLVVYVFLKMGMSVYVAVLSFVVVEMVNFIIRLYFAVKLIGLDIKYFLFQIVFKSVFVFLMVVLLLQIPECFMAESFIRLLIVILLSCLLLLFLFRVMILNKEEYSQVKMMLQKFKKQFLNLGRNITVAK